MERRSMMMQRYLMWSGVVIALVCASCGEEPEQTEEQEQRAATLTCGQQSCDAATQLCAQRGQDYACEALPQACAAAQSCECVAAQLEATSCTAGEGGSLTVVLEEAEEVDPCQDHACEPEQSCEVDQGQARCVDPDPVVVMFDCDELQCDAATQYCSVFVGGAPGSGQSYSCQAIPATCQGAALDCDCLKQEAGAQDCSQESTSGGYTVRTFAP